MRPAPPEAARESDNSVFLDERFTPYPDQWDFLSSIRKISRQEVEEVVHRAEAKGRVISVSVAYEDDGEESAPWTIPPSRRGREAPIPGPLPETLELTLGNQIYVPKGSVVACASQPSDPLGGIPKSRVLQSAGHAACDLR